MSFLTLLQEEWCHPVAPVLGSGPTLQCPTCGQLTKVYEWINRPRPDYFRSSDLAQAYAEWTGDEQVPLSFPLSHIQGIRDTVVVGEPLARVRQAVRLLQALNAPFTSQPLVSVPPQETESFLTNFMNILTEHPAATSTDERVALDALMKSMHQLLTAAKGEINPFETYFNVLVPYVQSCVSDWTPFDGAETHTNLARELHLQLVRSRLIRQVFSRYAIPFDVLHVMVACFACSVNMDIVSNWAIDFLARVCRGEFDWQTFPDNPYVKRMQQLVRLHYNYTRRAYYYNLVVKPIRRGESIDQYSQLWAPYHQVLSHLQDTFTLPNTSREILQMAFSHCFPAVLFQDYADYLGFTMGYNHLLMAMNRRHGFLPKGSFKKAKLIHDVVRRFVQRMSHFNAGLSEPIWDLEMVKLFFVSDPAFHQEIMSVIKIVVAEEEEE